MFCCDRCWSDEGWFVKFILPGVGVVVKCLHICLFCDSIKLTECSHHVFVLLKKYDNQVENKYYNSIHDILIRIVSVILFDDSSFIRKIVFPKSKPLNDCCVYHEYLKWHLVSGYIANILFEFIAMMLFTQFNEYDKTNKKTDTLKSIHRHLSIFYNMDDSVVYSLVKEILMLIILYQNVYQLKYNQNICYYMKHKPWHCINSNHNWFSTFKFFRLVIISILSEKIKFW